MENNMDKIIKLIPICLVDNNCDYRMSYIINYGKEKAKNMYYIGDLNNMHTGEQSIINVYNLDYNVYKEIIEKNHGYHDTTFDEEDDINEFNFVFNSKKDCQKAIEELQPYIIIGILKK